jgi:transcriptional regulator with XRE-family HTH domain
MERTFPDTLSLLRRERNISQRKVAADLNISQALLSHYENGAREPGLSFVCKVCDYYGVSADYLLCRSEQPNATLKTAEAARTILDELNTLVDRAKLVLDEFAPEGELE